MCCLCPSDIPSECRRTRPGSSHAMRAIFSIKSAPLAKPPVVSECVPTDSVTNNRNAKNISCGRFLRCKLPVAPATALRINGYASPAVPFVFQIPREVVDCPAQVYVISRHRCADPTCKHFPRCLARCGTSRSRGSRSRVAARGKASPSDWCS